MARRWGHRCAGSAQVHRMKHPPVIDASGGRHAPTMAPLRFIGGCVPLFLVAVALDALGLILLFVGIFGDLRVGDRFYGDFLIYTGSLVVFVSLGCWLMWYVGNIEVSEGDGGSGKRGRIARLARKLSERLSHKLRGEERVKRAEGEERGRPGSPPRKASRVTWGKSTAYHNDGYDDFPDSPAAERKVDPEKEGKQAISATD